MEDLGTFPWIPSHGKEVFSSLSATVVVFNLKVHTIEIHVFLHLYGHHAEGNYSKQQETKEACIGLCENKKHLCFVSRCLSHLPSMGTLITNEPPDSYFRFPWKPLFDSLVLTIHGNNDAPCSENVLKMLCVTNLKSYSYKSLHLQLLMYQACCEWARLWAGGGVAKERRGLTYRPIELSFLIHAEVEASIHPPDADQTHCQTDELQDTWGQTHRIGQRNTQTHWKHNGNWKPGGRLQVSCLPLTFNHSYLAVTYFGNWMFHFFIYSHL